jgi:uncharacterized membrane protein
MSATTEVPGASPDVQGEGLRLVLPGNSCPAGEGIAWIGAGWKLFARAPLMWIISLVVLFIIAIALNLVPILGQIAMQLLSPVLAAGWVVACRSLERGGEFELEHFLAGFKRHFGKLVVLGAIFLALGIALLLVFSVFFGFSILAAFMAGDPEQAMAAVAASSAALLLGVLICLALFIPLVAAYWFAPALIVMHGMAPLAAMKASLVGSLRNIVPLLLWGIVMTVLMILGSIPFGLGLLVVVPLLISSSYAAYRSICTEERDSAAAGVAMVS